MTAEAEPTWDPKGRYLYFLSNRDFNLTFSGYEFDYVYTNPTRVYVGVLSKEGPALFLPESDEENAEARDRDAAGRRSPGEARQEPRPEGRGRPPATSRRRPPAPKAAPVRVKIDFDGFEQRVRAIPGPSGNYQALAANADAVFYLLQRAATGGPPSLTHVQPQGPQGGRRPRRRRRLRALRRRQEDPLPAGRRDLRHRRRPGRAEAGRRQARPWRS